MGEVYRARDPRIGREVAIKILPETFSKNEERLRRFEQEARTAGVLNHPNILAVYDVGLIKARLTSFPNCWRVKHSDTSFAMGLFPLAR